CATGAAPMEYNRCNPIHETMPVYRTTSGEASMTNDPQDLISIYRAANVTEAHLVKNLLLDADIDARVAEENEPLAGLSIAAPDVLVHRRDQARATTVIQQYEAKQIERVEGPEWTCAACGASNIAGYDSCDTCGAAREGS